MSIRDDGPGARGNESGDRPSPTFRKSPNPLDARFPQAVGNPRRCRRHPKVAATRAELGLPRSPAANAALAAVIGPGSKLATRALCRASGPCSASGASLETNCSTCSTGSATANPIEPFPQGLYDVPRLPPAIARWPPTTATERRGKSRWSSACSAPLTAAFEVFPGNTADPTTLAAQVRRIGVRRVALVGEHDHLRTHPHRTGRPGDSALRTVDLRKLL